MKRIKIWVFALLMILLFSGAGTMLMNVEPAKNYNMNFKSSDVEHISGVFRIDQNTTDPLTGEKGKYGFDSKVIVDSTGKLIVENATLYFLADVAHPRELIVYGSLILKNAVVTVSTNQIMPVDWLDININGTENSNAKVVIENSKILYNGWFKVENKKVGMFINNTQFSSINKTTYGPTPLFENSTLRFYNVSFDRLFSADSSGNVHIGNLTANRAFPNPVATVNEDDKYITNYTSHKTVGYERYWDEVPVKEMDVIYNYSTTSDYSNDSYLVIEYRNATIAEIPLLETTKANTYNKSIANFAIYDLSAQDVNESIKNREMKIYITGAHTGQITLNSLSLEFYIERNIIKYGVKRFDFNMVNSTIYAKDLYVGADFELNYGTTHNRISLYENSALYVLNLTVENTLNKLDSCIYANDSGSQAYIFRYARINVSFDKRVPIAGVYVNATSYLIDENLRNKVTSITKSFVENMSYGNISGKTIWAITNSNGYAYLPLLSDIFNKSEWPNTRFVGIYNMWVNKSGNNYYSAQIAVNHFPNQSPSNNTLRYNAVLNKYKNVDVDVGLNMISTPPYVVGNSLVINATIYNNGTDDANNTHVYVYVNNAPILSLETTVNLKKNSSKSLLFRIPGKTFSANGTYNITVKVQQMWDINSTNNQSTISVNVIDMGVSTWTIDKLIRHENANISFNLSSSENIPHATIKLLVDSTEINSWSGVHAGSVNYRYVWMVNTTAGIHNITVMVENTTIAQRSVVVYNNVEVLPTSISFSPNGPYSLGESINVTVYVKNKGLDNSGEVYVTVYIGSANAGTTTISNIGGGSSANVQISIPGTMLNTPGSISVSATISNSNDLNISDNSISRNIVVGGLSIDHWEIPKLIRGHSANINIYLKSDYTIHSANIYLKMDGNNLNVWSDYKLSGVVPLNYTWNIPSSVSAGEHTLSLYVNSTLVGSTKITILKDIDMTVKSLTVAPSTIYIGVNTTVNVVVTNLGSDSASAKVSLIVYDPDGNVVKEINKTYKGTNDANYSLSLLPSMEGEYRVEVSILDSEDANDTNNNAAITFVVQPIPISVEPDKNYVFVNGTEADIAVRITTQVGLIMNVTMFIKSLNITLSPVSPTNPITLSDNGAVVVLFKITPAQYQILLKDTTSCDVGYSIIIDSNIKGVDFKYVKMFSFTLYEKPDFQVVSGSVMVMFNNKIVGSSGVAEGVTVDVKFTARNVGGVAGNVSYIVKDGSNVVANGMITMLGAGTSEDVVCNYTISGIGTHTISVTLNPNKTVDEKKYTDDYGETTINVIPPAMEITYSVVSSEHDDKIYEGDHVAVIVRVINLNATQSRGQNVYLSGVEVTVKFGALGTYHAKTNNVGVARIEFVAKHSGKYTPTITASYHGKTQSISGSGYTIMERPLVERIPWLWVIIGAIAIGVAVFFLYGYMSFKKEASEYMICGNCGHLIPADSEKCPYCGAVFEKDKVQCPDCGSWIDADSKFCPVCGSVFMNKDEPDYDKQISMKERYEQYLSKYKEEARKYIGDNYTQEEFYKWWKTHPEFISFQEWMKRQEEEIEGETVKCDVCGALNPRGAKICRVCGSPLPGAEEKKVEKAHTAERTIASEESGEEDMMMKMYREEYERIQHPGVVSFEEWVRRKRAEEEKKKAPAQEPAKKPEVPKEKPKREKAKSETAPEKKVEEKVKEGYIKCEVCGALNKPDAKVCAVCGSPLTGTKQEKKEEKEKKSAPAKPVVKKKVIKKVISVKDKE